MNRLNLFNKLFTFYGTAELQTGNNTIIVTWLKGVLSWARNDEIPWCAAYVKAMLTSSGHTTIGIKANARSLLSWGRHTADPVAGDVVVLWRSSPRSWKGHVGFYIGEHPDNPDLINVLGGNQRNSVNIQTFPKSRILQYRTI